MKLQVGVKVVIKNSAGLYLLIQRSEPLPDGTGIKWDIPGGRINSDESLEDALAREVREELGIGLDGAVKLIGAQDIFIPAVDSHVVRLTYIAELEEDIALSSEHQRFQWVTQQEALALDVDPYLRQILESL